MNGWPQCSCRLMQPSRLLIFGTTTASEHTPHPSPRPSPLPKRKNGKIFPLVELPFRRAFVLSVHVWMFLVCFVLEGRIRAGLKVRVRLREQKKSTLHPYFTVYEKHPFH